MQLYFPSAFDLLLCLLSVPQEDTLTPSGGADECVHVFVCALALPAFLTLHAPYVLLSLNLSCDLISAHTIHASDSLRSVSLEVVPLNRHYSSFFWLKSLLGLNI